MPAAALIPVGIAAWQAYSQHQANQQANQQQQTATDQALGFQSEQAKRQQQRYQQSLDQYNANRAALAQYYGINLPASAPGPTQEAAPTDEELDQKAKADAAAQSQQRRGGSWLPFLAGAATGTPGPLPPFIHIGRR